VVLNQGGPVLWRSVKSVQEGFLDSERQISWLLLLVCTVESRIERQKLGRGEEGGDQL
jgi:hypothetical protein